MISIRSKRSPAQAAADYHEAADVVRADPGQEALFHEALGQLLSFVARNIEVDEGRTKNSVFPSLRVRPNGVAAMLGTNVRYAPYVRDGGHGVQFFKYAERHEVPRVLAWLGDEVVVRVEGAFA